MSEDGKMHYIGCSARKNSEKYIDHTYLRISASVDEGALDKLFQNLPYDENSTEAFEGPCSSIFSPRIGFKKKSCCEYFLCYFF